jgi:hypothetical protein
MVPSRSARKTERRLAAAVPALEDRRHANKLTDDRTDAGHNLALRQMAMMHQLLVAP